MSTPFTLQEPLKLVISDRGVATPTLHAASHADGGSDEINIAPSQVSGLGGMALQAPGSVAITGGSITGTTYSGTVTITAGTATLSGLTATSVTLSGGSINNTVIGDTDPADGTFDSLSATGLSATTATIGTLTLTNPLAVAQGGTGANSATNARANLGLGTVATQNSSAVALTGGLINGTQIGNTTPAAGSFTALTANSGATTGGWSVGGNLTVTGTTTLGVLALTTDLPVADGGTGASTAAAARGNLGLAIGTDVQAYDALLNAIAALTTVADRMIYTTGVDTVALATITSFARTLLACADADAAKTALSISGGSTPTIELETAFVQLTAGATGTVTDGSVTPNTFIIPIPVFGTGGAGTTHGNLSVNINDGVGYSVNSSINTDTRELRVLKIYMP